MVKILLCVSPQPQTRADGKVWIGMKENYLKLSDFKIGNPSPPAKRSTYEAFG